MQYSVTPQYVFQEAAFVENYRRFESCFQRLYPNYRVSYSFKTNYTPYVCRLVKAGESCGVDFSVISSHFAADMSDMLAGHEIALRGSGDSRAPMIIMLCSFVAFRQLYLFPINCCKILAFCRCG